MTKWYVVLSNSEDGNVRLELVTAAELLRKLNGRWWGEGRIFQRSDLESQCAAGSSWDFANEGPRGLVILQADAIVIPEEKTVVTEYELPR